MWRPSSPAARATGAYKRLRNGGRASLKLAADGKLAPRIRVHLTYSAPNSPETATKVLTLRLRDVRTPTPQVIGLKAVRRGRGCTSPGAQHARCPSRWRSWSRARGPGRCAAS